MKDFSMQLRYWMDKTLSVAEDKAEELAKQAVTSLIEKSPHPTGANGRPSPYSTGEFVNHWKVGSSVEPSFTNAPIASKEAKIAELHSKIDGWFKNNKSLYIWNSGPYVEQVEYLGWKYADDYAPILRTVQELKGKM